jgi:Tat protein translocase TatB subunit
MFGIGAGELFVIFIIAIVVIGPKQLPDVARTIGKVFTTFKRTSNQLRDQMQEEVKKFQEMEEVKEFKSVVESEVYNIQSTTEEYVQKEIQDEEKRFQEEARDLDTSLMAEGGPLAEIKPEPYVQEVTQAVEASAEPAAPIGDVVAAPPVPGSNGSSGGHGSTEASVHAAPAPDKPLS